METEVLVIVDDSASIDCPRCRALQQRVQLLPVEESLRHVGGSVAGLRPDDPPSQ